MKKLTVSIGIPAYNEEGNIKQLITSLLCQKNNLYTLDKIIVVSDASTDNTDIFVQSIDSSKIQLLRNNKRIGQAMSQQRIFSTSKSDVLVLLNADVLPANSYFIEKIISPFINSGQIGIVGAKVIPLKSNTFIESIINYSIQLKQSIFESINSGDTIYLCHGRARAFSKKIIKVFKWNPIFNEDAYSYLECKRLGFLFHYESSAEVNYRSPKNPYDHFKQSKRFFLAYKELNNIYPEALLRKEYSIPFIAISHIIPLVVSKPILAIGYIFLLISSVIYKLLSPNDSIYYLPSISSKKLNL